MSLPSKNRGFLQFLLGNPALLACAALGIALVLTGLGLKVYKSRYEAEYQKRLQAESVVQQMVATAKQVADENAKIVESWKQALVRSKTASARESALLRAELDRMRDHPVRPDGTAIPVATCPGTPDAVPGKLVSLAEYESLQERAARDALQVTQLQDYIRAVHEAAK